MTTFLQHVLATVERVGETCSYTYVSRQGRVTAETTLSFLELDERARQTGSFLLRRGTSGAVLLMFPAGLDFVWSFLGCLYSRTVAIPSPLPGADPRALERAVKIVADADVTCVLTDSTHKDQLQAWLSESGLADDVECIAVDQLDLPDASTWEMPPVSPEDIAYLQYTSGSTSEPRGVVVTQRSLLHNTHEIWQMLGSPEHGVCAGWLPHYHDMGLVGQFLEPFYVGGSLAFTSPLSFVRRPAIWLEMITKHRAGYTAAPNFAYQWCADHVPDEDLIGLDLAHLGVAMNGAEPVRAATLDSFDKRFAPVGFRRSSWRPAYGMAETTLLVTGLSDAVEPVVREWDPIELERDRAVPGTGPAATRLVSCGRAVSLDVRIVDVRERVQLTEGNVGEIWVRGGSVADGYWNDAEGTEAAFGGRLAGGDGPFLRTGDLGFFADGELFITGRLKDVVIVNGRNLYPQDIEEVAAAVHSACGLGAAFAMTGAREHAVLIQEVRPAKLGGQTPEELSMAIITALGDRLRLPDVSVVLVRAGGVERTTSGKVRRRRMRELFTDDALAVVHQRLSPSLVATRRAGCA